MPVLERSHCFTLLALWHSVHSGPGALCTFSPSNSLATPFRSTVMSPMGENGLAPLEGGSESPSRVKTDWNCLQIYWLFSAFFLFYVCLKETRSVTMNIFRKIYFLLISFVKIELSYIFTINMVSTAENCKEK